MSAKGIPNSSTYTYSYTSTVTGSSPMAWLAPKARLSFLINESSSKTKCSLQRARIGLGDE